jgi:hypothetical protein
LASDGIRRAIAAAAVGAVFLVALGGPRAHASSPHGQTRGEARAAFQAFFSGGFAIRTHNPLANGAPRQPGEPTFPAPESARIYPAADGVAYCEQGWHVVMLAFFDDPSLYGSMQELFAYLSSIELQFALDGVPLEMERTPIKRFQHPDFSEVPFMSITFGSFLPPGSLSEGTHELRTIFHDPVFGDFDYTTSFTVISC